MTESKISRLAATIAAFMAFQAYAKDTAPAPVLGTVVTTATREERASFELPLAVDIVTADQIQSQRIGVNVSETLNRVPGTVVQNRETYAQEQQISIRGFGARSQFGVRGIKLLADGIPASTPDGQGGSGLFDLSSARRIEVLRGAFSTLYGNHSGGVIEVFTEDGPDDPTTTATFTTGSHETWRAGLKFGGQHGDLNYTGSVSRFETGGYRDWSDARKDQLNARLRHAINDRSSLTVVLNYMDQPDNQDPLGLTAEQLAASRRQASPVARQFRTRRSLENLQAGAVYQHALTDTDTVRVMGYAGSRSNEQYLAIPTTTQNGLRHAGGVSTFDRDFWGTGLRWTHRRDAVTLTMGAEYERGEDSRKGYLNNLGLRGALKRDEANTVWQAGGFAQAEWQLAEAWRLSAGLRYTKVRFDSRDKFICTTTLVTAPGATPGSCSGSTATITATNQNPDDSGAVSHDAWTPAVGLLYELSDSINLYANAGRSFETPTFIELAYRPDGSSGLNLELRPNRSNHYEIGAKILLGERARLNLALFQIDTEHEIVTATNAGGRTSFQNAGDSRRRGAELALDARLGSGFSTYLSATWLHAEFRDSFRACSGIPCSIAQQVVVPAGNHIPGVPQHTVYGELAWQHAPTGLTTALEARWSSKIHVNDLNTARARDYVVANLRAGFEQRTQNWRFTEFVRLDNVFDEKYVGAVYVNDANGRFYAPAPGRSFVAGVNASFAFR
jgi:iron complex outermembrane receptor protein